MTVRHLTAAQLRARLDELLAQYPFFAEDPDRCCSGCAWVRIAAEHGHTAAAAWFDYDSTRWLLNGGDSDERSITTAEESKGT